MVALGIQADKTPAGVDHAIRSDGDTIPYVAAGTEVIGQAIELDATVQFVGIVSALTADYSVAAAVAGDEIELRIKGLAYVKKAAAAWTAGTYAQNVAGTFETDTTGAHYIVSDAANTDSHGLVLLNQVPRAATT